MARVDVTDEQIKAAQAGDSAVTWEIVEAFDPMLTGMIRSVARGATAEDAEDLLQEARVILIQHIRDYDTDSSSAKLSSFVFQAVRRRIAEEYVSMTLALTVDPTAVLRVRRALWQADGDVEGAWLIVSSCPNVKSRMERERFMSIVEALAETASLDAPAGGNDFDESGLTLADVIEDPTASISDTTERINLARWLLTQIPQRQSFALRAFYGIQMTQQDDAQTCDDMCVKPARLRALRHEGVNSARKVAVKYDIQA